MLNLDRWRLHQIAGLKKIAGVLIWVIKATPLTTVILNLQFDASKKTLRSSQEAHMAPQGLSNLHNGKVQGRQLIPLGCDVSS